MQIIQQNNQIVLKTAYKKFLLNIGEAATKNQIQEILEKGLNGNALDCWYLIQECLQNGLSHPSNINTFLTNKIYEKLQSRKITSGGCYN